MQSLIQLQWPLPTPHVPLFVCRGCRGDGGPQHGQEENDLGAGVEERANTETETSLLSISKPLVSAGNTRQVWYLEHVWCIPTWHYDFPGTKENIMVSFLRSLG